MVFRLNISIKLMSTVVGGIIGYTLVTVLALSVLRNVMIDDRVAKVRSLTEVAREAIRVEYQRVKSGEISEEEGRKLALALLRQQRYDGTEYFFVYDEQGTVMLNPSRPDREGKNLIDAADADGVHFIKALLDGSRAGGKPVFYQFPKPGGEAPVPKVSYSLWMEEWHWMVGTGLYLDDINAEFWRLARTLVGVVLVIVVIALAWVFMLTRHIAAPLVRLSAVTRRLVARDYDADALAVVGSKRSDEIGELAQAIGILRDEARQAEQLRHDLESRRKETETERRAAALRLADAFEGSVKQVADVIRGNADKMHGAAENMQNMARHALQTADSMALAAGGASGNVETVAAATEELAAAISEISQQVQTSSTISQEAVVEAERTDQLVRGLAAAVGRIEEVSGMIRTIAAQTNLLALNATIEAARAGEAGKGFAVVAGEVKQLATQTARATQDISSEIEAVQKATEDAVEAIRGIGGTISNISQISATIAAAVEEQHAATSEISRNIQQASRGTAEVAANLDDLRKVTDEVGEQSAFVLGATKEMAGQAGRLNGEVGSFLETVRK